MAICLYPLQNKYWKDSGADQILRLTCDTFEVGMPKLAEDHGEVVERTRLLAKLRDGGRS